MKITLVISLIFFCFSQWIYSQPTIEVKGSVSEFGSLKPLPGCQIVSSKGLLIGQTIENGNYVLSLQKGQKQLLYFSLPGYSTIKIQLVATTDTLINVALKEKIHQIDSVTVYANTSGALSQYRFTPMEAKKMVSLTGETDVLRYLQVLPGISSGMEGGLGLFVRGGNSGNNRVELDKVPVYATSHLFGLFSVFHPDVIRDISFHTGGITSTSGNFLSSLFQINTSDGNAHNYHGKFSVSPFMADGVFNGPIIKDKLVAQVAGRISLLRPEFKLIKSLTKTEGDVKPAMSDWFLKMQWNVHPKHTIKLLLYGSNDYFQYQNESDISINWGNSIAKVDWNWKINQTLFLETYTYQTKYYSAQKQLEYENSKQKNGIMLGSNLNEYAIQSVINYKSDGNWSGKGGISYQHHYFKPVSEKVVVSKNENSHFEEVSNTHLLSFFGEMEYNRLSEVTFNLGGRGYIYQNGNYRTFDADLRFLSDVYFTKSLGAELTIDKFSQFYHVLEGLPTGWSLDLMIPSDDRFSHENAWQGYSGIFWKNNQYHFSIGGYIKKMTNLVFYKNSVNLFGVRDVTWQDEIVSGNGESFGMEVRAEKKSSVWNWSLSYTLSKTNRYFPEVNDNLSFPFKFDRRHILNIQSQFVTKKNGHREQSISAFAAISSGHHETIPLGKYQGVLPPFWNQRSGGIMVSIEENTNAYSRQLLSSINGFTLPTYIRVDVAYNFKRVRKRYTREFTMSVFNVLNNQNPYLVFYSDSQWKQLSIFPILPSFKWSIEF